MCQKIDIILECINDRKQEWFGNHPSNGTLLLLLLLLECGPALHLLMKPESLLSLSQAKIYSIAAALQQT
jgi:hypothetical protein